MTHYSPSLWQQLVSQSWTLAMITFFFEKARYNICRETMREIIRDEIRRRSLTCPGEYRNFLVRNARRLAYKMRLEHKLDLGEIGVLALIEEEMHWLRSQLAW